ncbi:MAG: site-specific integrase [Trueperaceae bacterium]|nr:site-specific integrase [Trueperaceae bacterium]
MSFDLDKLSPQTQLEHARSWASLSSEDLKRLAAKAVLERDHETLWDLTRAYMFLHGAKGGKVSKHTLKSYRRGVLDLLESWQHENLLRPGRDAGVLYIRTLETEPKAETGKPLSPATVEVKLAAARTLYKALRWSGVSEAVPFENVKPAADPTPDWEKRQPYTVREVDALLELADPSEKVMVLLGAHAGLRISEMVGLSWSDIDWSRSSLKVLGKGGKRASVTMSARLEVELKRLRQLQDERKRTAQAADKVLPWASDRARGRFKELCQLAGVTYDDKAVHGLRHGAGTRYYAQTKDLGRVASHLRHENIQTTRVYAKLADEAIKDDLKDW